MNNIELKQSFDMIEMITNLFVTGFIECYLNYFSKEFDKFILEERNDSIS